MNILDKVQGEVRSLREAIDAEPSFRDFLRDPTINQQKKGKVLQEVRLMSLLFSRFSSART